ncbi:MAG: hypothetical protein FJ291_23585 [Planctomycetes bacterium]|nr:hypothetical protein [Planctomycetota bacterium]
MSEDPILKEVRAIRHRQAAKFNFDIAAMVEDAMKRQGKDGRKVVSRAAKRRTATVSREPQAEAVPTER